MGELRDMQAWLAETDAAKLHGSNVEDMPDEMIERHSTGHEVTTSISWLQMQVWVFFVERIYRFAFDQGHFVAWTMMRAKMTRPKKIAIPFETFSCNGVCLSDGNHRFPLSRGDIESGNGTSPHNS